MNKTLLDSEHILKIEKIVYGGHGLAREGNKTFLISHVAPNELIKANFKYRSKGINWAKLEEIIEPNSEIRINPLCEHVGLCGGCVFQHLNYESQIQTKENILKEIYDYNIELEQSLVSPQQFNYRNKCELTFGNNPDTGLLELGFHPAGKFFEVLNIKKCHLLPALMWNILQEIQNSISHSSLKAYQDLKDQGFWSTVTIRQSSSSNEVLIIFKVNDKEENKAELMKLSEQLLNKFPEVKGILLRPAPRGKLQILFGRDTLSQKLDSDFELIYQAENFFQINTFILPAFLDLLVSEIKNLNIDFDVIYDLFAGVGALGLYSAFKLPNIKKFVGAESDEIACKIASLNAELNNLNNYQSHHIDLYKRGWGQRLAENNKNICAIIDPPRAGLSQKTLKDLIDLRAKNIIYISCNPTTQRRDIKLLEEANYKLKSLRLIDMFPQTHHLESMALLSNFD